MEFEPLKITGLIEQNYSHFIVDFFEMQTEYLASLNNINNDLDTSLIGMVLTSQLYKKAVEENKSKEKISLKCFYQKDNFKIPISTYKIKEISSILNLPRETVRRKRKKLIKDKLIILDKQNKLYKFNIEMNEKRIIDIQINNLSKSLSKFSVFLYRNKFFFKEMSREKIKKNIEEKFLLHFTKFLDLQISYFSKMKNVMDIESVFILLLCGLNTTNQFKDKEKPISSQHIFYKLRSLNNVLGLNSTSISEITKVPRTTVLRKIVFLEEIGMLRKDKFKRYAFDNLNNSIESKKILSTIDSNIKLLGIFFSQCLET